MKLISIIFLLVLNIVSAEAQITERVRPAEWDNLVFGGRFMDRFLFMPDLEGMTSNIWGAKNVIPRDTNNGIEDAKWSYWGGNTRLMDDGKYHMFVCRWAENSPKGHMEWPKSIVVHTISENRFGPYKVVGEIGKGHNPEWYITKTGKYVIYVINGYYVSDDLYGKWEYKRYDFDKRDRKIIEGLTNLSFAKREDGSFVMICRGGGVWISKDGISIWNQVTDKSIYPPVDGQFEDPVIWKTNVQYHLIVNDWYGRIAWYLRSKDGINWKTDAGEAYLPGIAKYEDGTDENWFKYERIKMLQDKYGRAIQANFAVIDTLKLEDKPNDHHSSKNIVIPLVKGKIIKILNKNAITEKTKEIKLLIQTEPGFDSNLDVNFNSLKFGAPEVIDFGGGSEVSEVKKKGKDVVVIFNSENSGITSDNFVAKLLGKDKQGNIIFGYSKLPETHYITALLSARKPQITNNGSQINVEIENFGQVVSEISSINIFKLSGNESIEIAKTNIPSIKPFQKITLELKMNLNILEKDAIDYLVIINKGEPNEVKNTFIKPNKK